MNKVKVFIVDDSAFMRRILTDIINEDYRLEVIGTARNGEDCLTRLEKLSPDVITMDVEMPKVNGLEALKTIMTIKPTPVVMVSSLTKEGAESTIRAVTYGAVDFIEKPSGPISLDMAKVKNKVIQKILLANQANVTSSPSPKRCESAIKASSLQTTEKYIIAVGTSTGGPRALDRVIRELPASLPAPVIIVQHMPKGFTKSLAERLNKISAVEVKEAEQGDLLRNGHVYIAPGDFHMTIHQQADDFFVELDRNEPELGHRPSVNRMLESLSVLQNVRILTVIMTGMGADGTDALLTLKEKKPNTFSIAEAEESCVVYGMPKAVIKSGLADEIVPLAGVSSSILKALGH